MERVYAQAEATEPSPISEKCPCLTVNVRAVKVVIKEGRVKQYRMKRYENQMEWGQAPLADHLSRLRSSQMG